MNCQYGSSHTPGIVQFKAEKIRHVGMTGCLITHAALNLGGQNAPKQKFCIADLSDVSKGVNAHIDGFIGADVLSEFSAVRIDYKAQTVMLEQWWATFHQSQNAVGEPEKLLR